LVPRNDLVPIWWYITLFSQPIIIGKALVNSIHCGYRYIKIIKLPFIFEKVK